MSDTAKMMAKSLAGFAGGSSPLHRWQDIIDGKVVQDNRTAEQIINDVCKKSGIEVID